MKKSFFLFDFLAVKLIFYFLCKSKKGLMHCLCIKNGEKISFDELSILNYL